MTALAVAYRPPLGLGVVEALGRGEQVRVPMKGRTCPDCDDGAIYRGTDREADCSTCGSSGLVAPIQPATPCPDCGGEGYHPWPRHGNYVPVECSTCNGTRWVGGDLGLVTRQCRLNPLPNGPGPWLDECPHGLGEAFIHEPRLVVPWRTQVTDWTDGVATLVGRWPIDPPVVDMVDRTMMLPTNPPKFRRVPLSVDPGEVVTLP